MNRYLLIALAIAVGGLIGWWLSKRDLRGGRAADTTLVEEGTQTSLWPWIAGLAVLAIGLFLLAFHERADITLDYQPATNTDGAITPGQFEPGQFEQDDYGN